MKKIDLDDLVGLKTLLHFIVCSRGPGSETMTVNLWRPADKVLEETKEELRKEFDEEGDPTGEIASHLETLRNALTSGEGDVVCKGILSVETGFDEGYSYLINPNLTIRKMLKGIIKFELGVGDDSDIFGSDLSRLAYASAVYRAIINNWLDIDRFDSENSAWSSVNAWRNVKSELMPMWQVEQCMELFDLTKEQVLTCDCAVLRTSIVNPSEEYRGC